MASYPETEPPWGRPQRRGPRRAAWVGAAVVAVAAVGVVVSGGGAEEDLAVDEAEDPGEQPTPPPLDSAGWTRHTSLDDIRAVASATDGGVWAATRWSGLVRWHTDGDYEHHPLGDDVPGEAVTALAGTDDGSVWVATEPEQPAPPARAERGLAHFDGGSWTVYPADDLAAREVVELAVDGDGALWVAGNRIYEHAGLARFDGEEWTSHTTDDGLPAGELRSLTVDDNGAVWAAIHNPSGPDDEPIGGIARYDGGEWTTWHAGDELPMAHVGAVTGGGSVWAVVRREHGQAGDGAQEGVALLRFQDGEWVTAVSAGEVPADAIHLASADADGALWTVTHQEAPNDGMTVALARLRDGEWTRWTDDELPSDHVHSLAAAGNEQVWAATTEGLARFDGHSWTAHTTPQGPAGDRVLSAAADDDGAVWVGTNRGLSRFADGEWARWTAEDGLSHDVVQAVAVADGTVWAGTRSGVARFEGGEWTSTIGDGREHEGVVSLAVATDGAVWAATRAESVGPLLPSAASDGGLARFDGQAWQRRTDIPLDGVPAAVAVGEDGAVWVALRTVRGGAPQTSRQGGGVARFADGEWTAWTVDDGLPANDVLAVDVADGRVWAGTADGVARFDGRRWASAATGSDPLNLDLDDPAADSGVLTVAADLGAVWVGGKPSWSVARFDGRAWRVAEESPWLPVRAIALTDDAAWLGTDRGVVQAPR